MPEVYWIEADLPGRIGTMARPFPKDIDYLKEQGVDIVVSLLGEAEQRELGLDCERDECRSRNIDFRWLPIEDEGLPKRAIDFTDAAHDVMIRASIGQSVVIHCRMGIGRSSLLAAAALILGGMTPDQAWLAIEKARGRRVPDTEAQRKWVERYAIFSSPE